MTTRTKQLAICSMLVAAVGLVSPRVSCAQESGGTITQSAGRGTSSQQPATATIGSPSSDSPFGDSGRGALMSWPHGYATIRDEQHKVNKEIDEAVTAIRAADNRAETDKATEQLQGILDRVFERDLEQREREVAEIEQRVAELRKQLQRRVSHKDEIVDLQMKVVLAEADGLGFYRDSQPSGGGFSFPALVRGQQTVPDQTRDRASGPVPTRNRPTSSERGNY